MNGQRWTDVVKYMLAIDLDQAYAPWLTSTGNLSANIEMIQTTIMDNCKLCYTGNDLNAHQLKNDVSVLFNIGTSWWWSDFAPTWTMIWNPKGDYLRTVPFNCPQSTVDQEVLHEVAGDRNPRRRQDGGYRPV